MAFIDDLQKKVQDYFKSIQQPNNLLPQQQNQKIGDLTQNISTPQFIQERQPYQIGKPVSMLPSILNAAKGVKNTAEELIGKSSPIQLAGKIQAGQPFGEAFKSTYVDPLLTSHTGLRTGELVGQGVPLDKARMQAIGESAQNLVLGFMGETGEIKGLKAALLKETTEEGAKKILTNSGIPEELAKVYAPKFARATTEKEVASSLKSLESTLKTTKPEVKTFEGLPNLSTKLLEKFKGEPEKIKLGRFEEILNKAKKEGIRQADEQVIRDSLVVDEKGMVDLPKTAARVEEKLVPLEPTEIEEPLWSHIGEEFIGDGTYGEVVYQSPIKTNAGNIHFRPYASEKKLFAYDRYTGDPKDEYLNFLESKGIEWSEDFMDTPEELALREEYLSQTDAIDRYFSHVRYEDMADGKTRKILETQSDLFQKGRLEASIEGGMPVDLKTGKNLPTPKEVQSQINKLQPYNSNDPLAHLRTFREEVKRAAKDGKDTLLIPTGETAMKIEGIAKYSRWALTDDEGRALRMLYPTDTLRVGMQIQGFGDKLWIITDVLGDGKFKAVPAERLFFYQSYFGERIATIKQLINEMKRQGSYDEFAETFDISGKVDTQHFVYKLNEEAIPREARRMGLRVEGKVKVDNGEWWKIKIPKEFAQRPVEAFGVVAGIETDDQGNIKFNPEKAALGVAGLGVLKRIRPKMTPEVLEQKIKEVKPEVKVTPEILRQKARGVLKPDIKQVEEGTKLLPSRTGITIQEILNTPENELIRFLQKWTNPEVAKEVAKKNREIINKLIQQESEWRSALRGGRPPAVIEKQLPQESLEKIKIQEELARQGVPYEKLDEMSELILNKQKNKITPKILQQKAKRALGNK